MKTRSRALALLSACFVAAALASPEVVQAQTCPADLTSLTGQIQTPDLQALLTVRIDDMVAAAGSLDQAITNLSQRLDRFSAMQANRGNADDATTRQYIDDAVTVATAQLQALQCRKSN